MSSICVSCNTGISSTDFNADENPPKCSACKWETNISASLSLSKRIIDLEQALMAVYDIGHNRDCLFCGFKDKKVLETLQSYGIYTNP